MLNLSAAAESSGPRRIDLKTVVHDKPRYPTWATMKPVNRWRLIYAGVALTTAATLLLELSLTRIFSVVFYYHFACLAISIALFGLGAGGVFSYVVARWNGNLFNKLGRLSALNALLVILAVLAALAQGQNPSLGYLALIYFASALPFFLSGTIVSLAVSETIERVNRVYFFDLLGAAGGCLLLVPLLNSFGGPNTTIVAAVMLSSGTSSRQPPAAPS